jgi:NTF2 fold immunity protein of polymorphic toxin system component
MATTRRTVALALAVLATACQSKSSQDKRSAITATHTTDLAAEPARSVPDEQTAIRIADSVLAERYGRDQLESEKPLIATLSDTIWTVTGTLPPGNEGGVAEIEIRKADGRIIHVTHGL